MGSIDSLKTINHPANAQESYIIPLQNPFQYYYLG